MSIGDPFPIDVLRTLKVVFCRCIETGHCNEYAYKKPKTIRNKVRKVVRNSKKAAIPEFFSVRSIKFTEYRLRCILD